MPTNGQQNGHVSATFMQLLLLLHGGLKMPPEEGRGVEGKRFHIRKIFSCLNVLPRDS